MTERAAMRRLPRPSKMVVKPTDEVRKRPGADWTVYYMGAVDIDAALDEARFSFGGGPS